MVSVAFFPPINISVEISSKPLAVVYRVFTALLHSWDSPSILNFRSLTSKLLSELTLGSKEKITSAD